jgi:hypothetical protein
MSTIDAWEPVFTGEGRIRYFSLARHALMEALKLAGVGETSRVLLPEYLCRDLMASLHLLGAVPCWYPVAPDMTPATASSDWPMAKAVLAVNYFGFPQDLGPFQAYAERTGAVVIEDNAHGYLSCDKAGQWLGCRADLGVFSMRKTIRMPDGAALWISSSRSNWELSAQLAFDSTGLNPLELIKARIRRLPGVGEVAYKISILLARKLLKWETGSDISEPNLASEWTIPAKANPWARLLNTLLTRSVPAEIKRRRKAYARCAAVGERLGVKPVFVLLPPNCAPYAYAFRANSKALDEMRHYAACNGFDLVNWPDLPTQIISESPEYYKDVFMVNFLW